VTEERIGAGRKKKDIIPVTQGSKEKRKRGAICGGDERKPRKGLVNITNCLQGRDRRAIRRGKGGRTSTSNAGGDANKQRRRIGPQLRG